MDPIPLAEGHAVCSPPSSSERLQDSKVELPTSSIVEQSGSPCDSSIEEPEKSPTSKLSQRSCINYRPGFTSEIFKLEVLNVPPYVGFKQLKNRLKSMKLNPIKVKMSQTWCFVTFPSEEDRQV